MREKDLKETGLADMAFKVESDHEVQMARAELYKVAKYAIKMHEMLKGVEEREGLEGWVQSKITKAADYLSSVYHHMDYEMKFDEVAESKKVNESLIVTLADKSAGTKAYRMLVKGAKGYKADEKLKKEMDKEAKDASDYNQAMRDLERDHYNDSISYENTLEKKLEEAKKKKGLYANIHANREKGKKPRKKGAKGAPTAQDWKNAAKTAKESVEGVCPDCGNPSYTTLPEEKQKGVDGKVCWKGYKIGNPRTKKKGGKTVDNCVKM